jgi:hypothetical protein
MVVSIHRAICLWGSSGSWRGFIKIASNKNYKTRKRAGQGEKQGLLDQKQLKAQSQTRREKGSVGMDFVLLPKDLFPVNIKFKFMEEHKLILRSPFTLRC